MRLLEEDVGGELFERNARGITIKESGLILLQRARFILAQVEDSRSEVLAHHGDLRGTVRLAAPSSLAQILYVPLVNHFLDRYPKVELQLSEGTTQSVLDRLENGTIDVGIVTRPAPNKHMEFDLLVKEPIALVGQAGDPLLQKKTISPAVLQTLPLMMASGILPMLGEWASNLTPVVQVDSTIPMKLLVLSGRGYAIMPVSSMHLDLHAGKIAGSVLRGVSMTRMVATHRGRPVSRATREAIKQVHDEVATLFGKDVRWGNTS
jgi:LysR family nitrogen assimilation transcriptional regulator